MTTTITMTPEERLNAAFDEVDRAKAAVQQNRKAEQDAQAQANDMSGLGAAARRQWQNAEAKYRVLAAADAETKKLQEEKQQLQGDRDAAAAELMQASAIRDAAQNVSTLLAGAIEAVGQAIAATGHAAGMAQVAQSEVLSARDVATSAARKNALGGGANALGDRHDELEGHCSKLGANLASLQAIVVPLNTASTQAAGQVPLLQAEVQDLDNKLIEVNNKLSAQQLSGDIGQAAKERDDAQHALDDAPSVERQAQEALKSARVAREDAEKRYGEALERRDEAEQLFIASIDVSGPNAIGVFTAKAELTEGLPYGYGLVWSSEAGTVSPEKGGPEQAVSFNTGQLPAGSYDLVVHLERT
jgi:chromosome segregation ATPase